MEYAVERGFFFFVFLTEKLTKFITKMLHSKNEIYNLGEKCSIITFSLSLIVETKSKIWVKKKKKI